MKTDFKLCCITPHSTCVNCRSIGLSISLLYMQIAEIILKKVKILAKRANGSLRDKEP